ncbi:lysophospholipase [Clostridium acetobutylicum]|nr:lysophospholipase [Clostridium acetobutylicum]
MNIRREKIYTNGIYVPCLILEPINALGTAVVTHGYGGCKEEQLGLAYRVAELGITTYVIDLRGHGENNNPFDNNLLEDLEGIIKYCREFGGKVVAIGHSLGGRLSCISSADYKVGISPALDRSFGEKTKEILNNVRRYRTDHSSGIELFDVMKKLPILNEKDSSRKMIIYGSRDVPEIITACTKLKGKGFSVNEVEYALHSDIFTLESTFEYLINTLKIWFKIN